MEDSATLVQSSLNRVKLVPGQLQQHSQWWSQGRSGGGGESSSQKYKWHKSCVNTKAWNKYLYITVSSIVLITFVWEIVGRVRLEMGWLGWSEPETEAELWHRHTHWHTDTLIYSVLLSCYAQTNIGVDTDQGPIHSESHREDICAGDVNIFTKKNIGSCVPVCVRQWLSTRIPNTRYPLSSGAQYRDSLLWLCNNMSLLWAAPSNHHHRCCSQETHIIDLGRHCRHNQRGEDAKIIVVWLLHCISSLPLLNLFIFSIVNQLVVSDAEVIRQKLSNSHFSSPWLSSIQVTRCWII